MLTAIIFKAMYPNKAEKEKVNLGTLSIIFACVSLIFLPPVFGIAGFILGIIGITKGEGATAIVGLILSCILPIIGMIIGMILGALTWAGLA